MQTARGALERALLRDRQKRLELSRVELGVAFLLWYALGSLRRAFLPGSLRLNGAELAVESRGRGLRRAAALTWLNPHVYLDTMLLVGSIAATYDMAPGPMDGKWLFATGAATASIV